ncbi:MAG: DUF4412 domain-containing protein [Gemmatimonadales bacterium]
MRRCPTAPLAVLLALFAAPLAAQQAPQFRADVTQTGDTPFTGTMYFGGPRMRIEGTSDGEPMTMIIDRTAGRVLMLMPEDRMYMVMDLGSVPFTAPGTETLDPANPCSGGEVTECENLGTESVNGRTTRKWAYTRDGERETIWIATDLRFPVRIEDADGYTTDFTNVTMGTQPAALFEPPSDYTAMTMPGFGGFGGAAGRAGPPAGRGRGQVPPGAAGRGAAGRGAPQPAAAVPAGVDPAAAAQLTAQLQAMGLPPDQIAMAIAQLGAAGTVTNSAPWEAGDGWIADFVVTASYSDSGSREETSWTTTYSARFTASVPLIYGTPAVGAAKGPAWQLVAGLGSPLGQAQRITFSGNSEYRYESTSAAACDISDGSRTVTVARATGSADTNDFGTMMLAQALWQISGDLSTHSIQAGARADETSETSESTTTITQRCPGSQAQSSTETETRTPSMGVMMNLTDLPLPASPGVIRGTATQTMPFDVAGAMLDLPATVEWTLRPID